MQWDWSLQVGWPMGCFSLQGFLRWLLSPSSVVSFRGLSSKLDGGMKDQLTPGGDGEEELSSTGGDCPCLLLKLVQRFYLPPAKTCCSILTLTQVSLTVHTLALPLGCFMPSATLSRAHVARAARSHARGKSRVSAPPSLSCSESPALGTAAEFQGKPGSGFLFLW